MSSVLRRSGVLLLALALVVSGVAPASVAASSDDQFRSITESGDVSVWERAVLPLRADADDAATVVPNLNLFVSVPGGNGGEVPANRGSLAVYDENATVSLRFQSRLGADTSGFAGEDVQLLVAKMDVSAATESEGAPTSMPIERGASLLSSRSGLATYELLDGSRVDADGDGALDGDGAATLEYDLSERMRHGADRGAGEYVFFLVQNGRDGGLEVSDDGNLSVTGDARVLGVDGALVQQARATATTPAQSYDAGDSIQFSVDADLDTDESVNHAVVLYKQAGEGDNGFVNQKAVVSFDGTPSRNLSAENATVRRSIGSVHGVARTDGNASVMGRNLTDGRVDRGVSVPSLVEWVSEKSGTSLPSQETIEPTESVPASATAVRTQTGSTTLTVETLANWSTGDYRYVYVASTDDGSKMSTRTGVLSVRASGDWSASGNRDGSGGGIAPSAGAGESSADRPDVLDESERRNPSARRVRLGFDRSQVLSESVIEFAEAADGTVRIEELSALPAGVPSAGGESRSAVSQFHIYVPDELSDRPASLRFTLAASELTGDPASLTLMHYNDTATEWEALETAVVERDDRTVTIEATTPGFSLFAITQDGAPRGTSESTPQVTPDEPQTPRQDDPQSDLQAPSDGDGAGDENALSGLFTGISPVIVALVIVVLGGAAFVLPRRRE